MTRAAGILLHPTCLPGSFGIGDLGPAATRFADWLGAAGQAYWQTLPLSPIDESGSPYRCFSAFAGNPLLISPETLMDQRLLDRQDLEDAATLPGRMDPGTARSAKTRLLRQAWQRPRPQWPGDLRHRFEEFCDDTTVRAWLDDWTLFAALKDHFAGRPWYDWPTPLSQRQSDALAAARHDLAAEIDFHRFAQFLFFDQWTALRGAARDRGVHFVGDLAIYVAPDSADVWSNQEIFDLETNGQPRTVAGVPPDYFSETGQLWGNPLYRWDRLAESGFDWWIRRLAWSLRLADVVRLDHFRGFASYWEVDSREKTAINGRWRSGPGLPLFTAARQAIGDLPLIAEDLGVITDDVRTLRKAAGLPGMRVLHFAFSDDPNEHLPHRIPRDAVVCTGTHDNDTTSGWFESLGESERRRVLDYVGGSPDEISWSLIRTAYTTVAKTAIVPLQDVLSLGSSARMNQPGEGFGQWSWRLSQIPGEDLAERLLRLAVASERAPRPTLEHDHPSRP